MRCYLCGKMRGIDNFNFPTFNRFARLLRRAGWDVTNPAEIDLLAKAPWTRADDPDFGDTSWVFTPEDCQGMVDRDIAILRSLNAREGDSLILLPGDQWRTSTGGVAEAAVARWLKLGVQQIVVTDESEDMFRLVPVTKIGDAL